MKYCPVCKLEYSDNAEFCKKCETLLLEKEQPQNKIKTDFKGLFKVCAGAALFIVFIMLIYYVYYLLSG